MTNVERVRRGFATDPFCVLCAGQLEDCNHLFRFCKEARSIWEATLGRTISARMECLDWDGWLQANLLGDSGMGLPAEWPARFAIHVWWIWRWQNDAIFRDKRLTIDQKIQWLKQTEHEITKAFSKPQVVGTGTGHHVEETVQWKKPPLGWIKLNVDGSCVQATGVAACGGLIRDHQGRWLRGFMHNIGSCSTVEAEAWAVMQGLNVAVQLGVRNIVVESDSKETIDGCCGLRRVQGNARNIINRCTEMAKRFTNISFCHVFR